jgi:hypothetical protein
MRFIKPGHHNNIKALIGQTAIVTSTITAYEYGQVKLTVKYGLRRQMISRSRLPGKITVLTVLSCCGKGVGRRGNSVVY